MGRVRLSVFFLPRHLLLALTLICRLDLWFWYDFHALLPKFVHSNILLGITMPSALLSPALKASDTSKNWFPDSLIHPSRHTIRPQMRLLMITRSLSRSDRVCMWMPHTRLWSLTVSFFSVYSCCPSNSNSSFQSSLPLT